jgi:hypothetical protein
LKKALYLDGKRQMRSMVIVLVVLADDVFLLFDKIAIDITVKVLLGQYII